jgi:hypothetical protein
VCKQKKRLLVVPKVIRIETLKIAIGGRLSSLPIEID